MYFPTRNNSNLALEIQKTQKSLKIQRNPQKSKEIPRNPKKSKEIPRNQKSMEIKRNPEIRKSRTHNRAVADPSASERFLNDIHNNNNNNIAVNDIHTVVNDILIAY